LQLGLIVRPGGRSVHPDIRPARRAGRITHAG
jgi:hypothetical protein